jgi:hypothetical protein
VLADYCYVTLRLSDDWNGADFIAQHMDGSVLRVQLKSRLSFFKRYLVPFHFTCSGTRSA